MHPQNIIWAGDDPDDLELIKTIISDKEIPCTIHSCSTDKEILRRLEKVKPEELPNLIIIELNVPVMEGKYILTQLRANTSFQNIPVIIYTSSNSELDKLFCAHYEAVMITKPLNKAIIEKTLQAIFSKPQK
jgi:CheY-like chemotaxis protein